MMYTDESKKCCDECGTKCYEDDLGEIPIKWNFGQPTAFKHYCDFCIAEMENNGELTRCESCTEVFFGEHLKVNPQNGIKEICPYCGEVWCE